MPRLTQVYLLPLALPALITGCGSSANMNTNPPPAQDLTRINHFVVMYLENHSFDNLYGSLTGAEGLLSTAAKNAPPQINLTGAVYATLPQPLDTNQSPPVPDTRFPANLPNAPFDIDQYVPDSLDIPDLVHRFYQEPQQIDGGRMDKFAAISDAAGLSMGYYKTSELPLAQVAQSYTVCDHFFHAAFGGSFLNHMWLIAAASPVFPGAPSSIVAKLDPGGNLISDGQVTPDGYVVNTSYSVNSPHPASANPSTLVPQQTMTTIGDLLSAKGVSWAWYSGGYASALAGMPDPEFQFHHQPFVYFANYKDGTQAKADHLKDETDLVAAIQMGALPAVSFYKPIGEENEHPGYTDVATGELHALALINAIQASPNWNDTAIIVTYDENGGQWDHVAPPTRDKWGPGTRVPTLIISPFAKRRYVDKTPYDTVSIMATIEHRFQLGNTGGPDATAQDLTPAFDFTLNP